MDKSVDPWRLSEDDRLARTKTGERVCCTELAIGRCAEPISYLDSMVHNGIIWPFSCKGANKGAGLLTECWRRRGHHRSQTTQDKTELPGEVSHKCLQYGLIPNCVSQTDLHFDHQ